MKIAIDCCDLDHSRIDGTRVYIKNVLDHLGAMAPKDQFLLYHQKDFNPLLVPKNHPNYIDRKIPYKFCWTQTRLAFELRKDRPDVCWMPIQQIPLIGPAQTKYVVTIHDLAFKYFPGHFPTQDRLKLNFFADTAIKRADRIIAISNSTKNDILRFYPKVNEKKIKVVHHGFDRARFGKKYSDKEIEQILCEYKILQIRNSKFEIRNSYILSVGAIQPRKNLITLIAAYEKIRANDNGFNDLKLVLVGEPAWKAESTLEKIKRSPFRDGIILTGKVGFDDLARIYQGASVFVYPSLYEGFGIPILEAFASGVPVIVADNSSLGEVGGDAVVSFDGNKVNELVAALQKVLNNSTIRTMLVEKGQKRATEFSWKKCAQETLNVLTS